MKRTLMLSTVALALVAGGLLFTRSEHVFSSSAALAQTATAQQQATFTIENMTCALCPFTVKRAMRNVTGVTFVAVDFGTKTATVTFDPSKATTAAIARASSEAGYPAHATKS
jgi:mercuric ion binding protein